MIEHILKEISKLSPLGIYWTLLFFSFIENIFPPSPSDLVVVIAGTLIGTGAIYFAPALAVTTVGSVIGFMVLYYLGSKLDKKVIRAGKIKFISQGALDKTESWFNKYGFGIILINRFLPGTRSVISFFAGLSELNIHKTIILSTISAILWNGLILALGVFFGKHVEIIDKYLSTYSNIVLVLSVVIVLFLIIRYYYKKRKTNNTSK